MGLRGEIFSTRVQLQNRTYFFNVKENRMGDVYLNIVESKNKEEGGFERQSVVVFAEDLQQFLSGFEEALKVMDKDDRAKKRLARNSRAQDKDSDPSPKKRTVVRKNKEDGKKHGKPTVRAVRKDP